MGFNSEIVFAAVRRAGYDPVLHFMPWARCMVEVAYAKKDLLLNAYYSKKREETFLFSIPYTHIELYLMALKSSGLSYDGTAKSLHPYRIGILRGSMSTPGIDNDPAVKKDYASSEISNIKKLFKGRVDAVVVDRNYALYQLRNLDLGGRDTAVTFLEPPLASHTVHLAISRNHPRKQEILEKMNTAICTVITDATADAIMEKWGFKKMPDNIVARCKDLMQSGPSPVPPVLPQ
jgi:polar amino acid transport system substrate-binding protein